MAIRCIRKTDRHRIVHTMDDAVTLPPGDWEDGWIAADTPGLVLGEDATVVEIRPLDALEVVETNCYDPSGLKTPKGAALASYYLERIAAARLGIVSVTGLGEGEELPHPVLHSLGTEVLHLSLGLERPFVLTRSSEPASSAHGSGETPSASTTASPPAAKKPARRGKGPTARTGTGRAARGTHSTKINN